MRRSISMSMRVILFAVCFLAAMTPSSSFAQGENVELVGLTGGPIRTVSAGGDYVYLG
ncbi:hypothetical protein IIC65_00400 [Candidatus Sumerlaeota bacterium]|nr:hypothetical protein [Candidatus Sumerlaeota bacterium]